MGATDRRVARPPPARASAAPAPPHAAASATALALALVAACADGTSPTHPSIECPPDLSRGVSAYEVDGRSVWTVLPVSTNTCITENPDSHFVAVDPDVARIGRLFVFLPGSSAKARNYRRIVLAAAASGYHAIGLTYVNDLPVAVRCAVAGAGCYADVRLEVVTGTDSSPRLTVGRDDSIEGRLVRLLQAMESLDPGGGWSAYHDGTTPRWDRISIAGHSQGGGHSLFIAQRNAVYRATAYSSAGDLIPLVQSPAPWLADSWATPADRRFGFISERDEIVPADAALTAWSAAGLDAFGPAASVDTALPPWGGTHMLTTRVVPRNAGAVLTPNHGVTVVDGITPLDGVGTPTLAPVWQALSFPPD